MHLGVIIYKLIKAVTEGKMIDIDAITDLTYKIQHRVLHHVSSYPLSFVIDRK